MQRKVLPLSAPPCESDGREPRVGAPFPALLTAPQWAQAASVLGLTPRERAVAEWLCRGLSDAGVCRQLRIARPTLRTHLRSIYRKAGCGSRVALVLTLIHRICRADVDEPKVRPADHPL